MVERKGWIPDPTLPGRPEDIYGPPDETRTALLGALGDDPARAVPQMARMQVGVVIYGKA